MHGQTPFYDEAEVIRSSTLLRLMQTCEMVSPTAENQTLLFIQEIGITSAPRAGDGQSRPVAEPYSVSAC